MSFEFGNFSRRKFLKAIAGTGAAIPTANLFAPLKYLFGQKVSTPAFKALSIFQGPTSETETQISICAPAGQTLLIAAVDSKDCAVSPTSVIVSQRPFSDHQFITAFFANLELSETYTLRVIGENRTEIDRRQFRTLDIKKSNFRAAVMSCAHDRNADKQEAMWKAVEAAKPEVIFFIGDLTYVDRFGPGETLSEAFLWKRYVAARNLLYLYQMPQLIPMFVTWDDHDTGTNDCDKSAPLLTEARSLFDISFPRHEIPGVLQRTFGVGSHLNIFGLNILLMDDRSFRSAYKDPQESHWGYDQEAWLEKTLSSTETPVWIMDGTQFFGGYRGPGHEGFEWEHPQRFEWFKNLLAKSRAPVLLTSGDIHYSEIQRVEASVVGYPLYEITSSSIHTTRHPAFEISPNLTGRRMAVTGEFNFMVLDMSATTESISVCAQSIGANSKVYFEKQFTVTRA